eukprot:scaffold10412_cov107-Isochrysis_galbana.AAC.4
MFGGHSSRGRATHARTRDRVMCDVRNAVSSVRSCQLDAGEGTLLKTPITVSKESWARLQPPSSAHSP